MSGFDAMAYLKGSSAAQNNASELDNPYPESMSMHAGWHEGYTDAR